MPAGGQAGGPAPARGRGRPKVPRRPRSRRESATVARLPRGKPAGRSDQRDRREDLAGLVEHGRGDGVDAGNGRFLDRRVAALADLLEQPAATPRPQSRLGRRARRRPRTRGPSPCPPARRSCRRGCSRSAPRPRPGGRRRWPRAAAHRERGHEAELFGERGRRLRRGHDLGHRSQPGDGEPHGEGAELVQPGVRGSARRGLSGGSSRDSRAPVRASCGPPPPGPSASSGQHARPGPAEDVRRLRPIECHEAASSRLFPLRFHRIL